MWTFRRDGFRPWESDIATARKSLTRRNLPDSGMGDSGSRASKSSWKPVVLGCLAWYLAVFGLLALLSNLSGRQSGSDRGPADPQIPTAMSPPEGSNQHQ